VVVLQDESRHRWVVSLVLLDCSATYHETVTPKHLAAIGISVAHRRALQGGSLMVHQVFSAFEYAALIAFEPPQIIPAPLLRDHARGLLLAMHGVGRDEHFFEGWQASDELGQRWNLVAFVLDGHLPQRQAQTVRHHREKLQGLAVGAPAPAQSLAINGKLLDSRHLLLKQPS